MPKRFKKRRSSSSDEGGSGFKPSSIFRHNKETGENKTIDVRFWDNEQGENIMFEAKAWVSGEEGGDRVSTKLIPSEVSLLGTEFLEIAKYEARKKHDIAVREILQALEDDRVVSRLKQIFAEVIGELFEE